MAKLSKTTRSVSASDDFPFFAHLCDFYIQNRSRIRQRYHELTCKFLDFNDPANATAFLRPPQFEALEMYVFLKEFLNNRPVYDIFREWAYRQGKFEGRGFTRQFDATGQVTIAHLSLSGEPTSDLLDSIHSRLRAYACSYPNYIFALSMGTGKTILMATCVFYEFILAHKFPKDTKYCHNALVFAPDTTMLESLREIQTFDKSRVVPPEYISWLDANIRFHLLDEAGMTLNVLDQSQYNLIISNAQKVILQRQQRTETPMDQLMLSPEQARPVGAVYKTFNDLYGDTTKLTANSALMTTQCFQKLQRLTQLGIYVDEAHHTFGKQLADDMAVSDNDVDGENNSTTSLRLTINELAASLERAKSHIVACYNYTGTPYVHSRILPEVVYAFAFSSAIDNGFLKRVRLNGYTNAQTTKFVEQAIGDFIAHIDLNERHEGILPKMALFAANVYELQNELRPAVEHALAKRGISVDTILVHVGEPKLTANGDVGEFRNLDKPESSKQFILLLNKGRECWNCRSLLGVALYNKPRSKIFVLQASMLCLRSIGTSQRTGHVYLSHQNIQILEEELVQNLRLSVEKLVESGGSSPRVTIHVKVPVEKVRLARISTLYSMREREHTGKVDLHLADAPIEQYHRLHAEHEGLSAKTEDLSATAERRIFMHLTLVAEIARYLNRSCLEVDRLLANTAEGIEEILTRVNEFNELLYHWVIPRVFKEFYAIEEFTQHEEQTVDLVKVPPEGYYEMNARSHLIVSERNESPSRVAKSFHLDTYCFDSGSEKALFEHLLVDGRVQKIFFTGMHTHGQSDFYIQYIDPESHTIRSYYPDFLLKDTSGKYIIVEVKADNQVDAPVVIAKQTFAEQCAASNMSYCLLKSKHAETGQYEIIWHPERREAYLGAIVAERPQRLFGPLE